MSIAQPPVGAEPLPMTAVVGYDRIDCTEEDTSEDRLVLKHDRFFAIVTTHGDVAPAGSCSVGLFHDDTRILSASVLQVAGGPPRLLSAEAPRTYAAQIDLAVKDLPFGGDPWDPTHAVHIRRELVLSDRLGERVTLTNHLGRPLDFWLELSLASDFADIFEVRGWRRAERGQFFAPQPAGDRLLFRYRGRDGRTIGTMVRFLQPPDHLSADSARWEFTLPSQVPFRLEWEVVPVDVPGGLPPESRRPFDERRAAVERHYRTWRQSSSRWTTEATSRIVTRSSISSADSVPDTSSSRIL